MPTEEVTGCEPIGYAVKEAEGMYEWTPDGLVWYDPDGENLHLEVSVRDAADGRFVPGVRVVATLIDPSGREAAPMSSRSSGIR